MNLQGFDVVWTTELEAEVSTPTRMPMRMQMRMHLCIPGGAQSERVVSAEFEQYQ